MWVHRSATRTCWHAARPAAPSSSLQLQLQLQLQVQRDCTRRELHATAATHANSQDQVWAPTPLTLLWYLTCSRENVRT
eukprot:SAG11_NODE_426_length_9563_cov_7.501479_2_plen_79_part_00